MKITGVRVFQVDLPLHEGAYRWSGGKSVEVFDSTVVAIDTDEDLTGWGEACPLGPAYLPDHAGGVRAALAELAPGLMGLDPTATVRIAQDMDRRLKGHAAAKSAIDMACWDLLGQSAGMPLVELLGGRCGDDFTLYRAISQDTPEAMAGRVAGYREEGYRRFQLKVGSGVATDIRRIRAAAEVLEEGDVLIADANTGWQRDEAARVVRGIGDVDVYVEQPCADYASNLSIRRRCRHPFVLDESITGLEALLRAHADDAMDAVNLKMGKLGGITRLRTLRDLCVDLGIAMTIEDSWGGDLVTAAIAHLAHSTPPELLLTATDFNSYVTVELADGAPRRNRGRMAAPTAPGLGVRPRLEVLGEPVARFEP